MRPRLNVLSVVSCSLFALLMQCFRAVLIALAALATLSMWVPAGLAQTGAGTSVSGSTGQIQAMKLLGPGVGWVLQQNHLYWTQNNGRDWNDITPGDLRQRVEHVFFLNEREGWAFLHHRSASGEQQSISVASTQDGGVTWKISTIASEEFIVPAGFAGPASIFFLDSQNGWMVFRLTSSSAFSFGLMLKTEDGGITWKELSPPPAAGDIRFATPTHGWMVGGPAGNGIWGTDDGGNSWHKSIAPGSDINEPCRPTYSLQDSSSEQVIRLTAKMNCSGHSYLFEYALRSEDESWHLDPRSQQDARRPVTAISTFAGPDTVYIQTSSSGVVTIQTPMGENSTFLPLGTWPQGGMDQTTFFDAKNGWMLYSAGQCAEPRSRCTHQRELLVTTDGGITLVLRTPPILASSLGGSEKALPSVVAPEDHEAVMPMATIDNASYGSNAVVIQAEGFDLCAGPTAAELQTQWSAAGNPYSAFAPYIGGYNMGCPQSQNASWVQQVGAQGWGLLPLWVGVQAVAGCSNCHQKLPTASRDQHCFQKLKRLKARLLLRGLKHCTHMVSAPGSTVRSTTQVTGSRLYPPLPPMPYG